MKAFRSWRRLRPVDARGQEDQGADRAGDRRRHRRRLHGLQTEGPGQTASHAPRSGETARHGRTWARAIAMYAADAILAYEQFEKAKLNVGPEWAKFSLGSQFAQGPSASMRRRVTISHR